MAESDVLKYGTTDGKTDEVFTQGAFAASVKLLAKSGRFVVYDVSDGYWKAAVNDATQISGFVDEVMTASATAGATKLPIRRVQERTFELPYAAEGAAAALTEAVGKALIGKLIDLYVDANGYQYADNLATPLQKILRVEACSVARNTLTVSVIDSAIVQQA